MSPKQFMTSDIALASYLVIRGYPILGISRGHANRVIFHFKDRSDRKRHVLEFFNRQAVVEPLAFLDNVKSLKAMINQNLVEVQ